MRIIKLNAIDSTNSYLRRLSLGGNPEDYTVAMAKMQTNGRGQMGTVWESQKEKNLTFSIYRDLQHIKIQHHFYISMVVALSIVSAFKYFNLKNLSIKWPNDILSDNKKIGGILIENVFKKNDITASIIGIGINVNQTRFDNLPNASSLRKLTGRVYDIDELAHRIVAHIQSNFIKLKSGNIGKLWSTYHDHLFRNLKPSTFEDQEGQLFSGYIQGVTEDGKLIVLLEDQLIRHFNFKEVSLKY